MGKRIDLWAVALLARMVIFGYYLWERRTEVPAAETATR